VDIFETNLADKLGIEKKNIIAVNSGSAALFLILKIFYSPNSTIAMPCYSCSSIYQAIKLAGHKPLFFDVHANSVEFDFPEDDLYDAIVVPHLFGLPCSLRDIPRHKCIEDVCQAFGAISNNKFVGSAGRFSVCSFGATKPFTVGGNGGALICRAEQDANIVRQYLDYDMKSNDALGFNFGMSDVNASIGIIQLIRYFQEFIEKRHRILEEYRKAGINLLLPRIQSDQMIGFRAIAKFNDSRSRDYVKKKLFNSRICSIVPIARKEIMSNNGESFVGAYSNTENFLSLPCYPNLLEKDLDRIISEFKKHANNLN